MTYTIEPRVVSPVAQAASLSKLGIRLFLQDRLPESLAALQSALSLTPTDVPLLNNLAVVQDRSSQPAEAIATLQRSLAMNASQPEALLHLGNLSRSKGDLPAAQAAYQAALGFQPAFPLAWQSLALVHQSLHQPHDAIRCLLASLEYSAPGAPVLSILGQLFYETGQIEKSHAAYSMARDLEPVNPLYHQMLRETDFAMAVLRGLPTDDALQIYHAARTVHPAPDDKDTAELLQTTFALLRAHGYAGPATRVAAFRAALYPDSATAAYLLRASAGDQTLLRSPDAYLVESFNAFADRFDEHLTQTLQYDIPEKLAAALRDAGILSVGHALDAGCGTGLCAPHLRPLGTSLTGVDISPKMLARARATGLYDHLHCAELTAFLAAHPDSFGVICAADVLIYFGGLGPLAAAFAMALKPGGILAFSTESLANASPDSQHLLLSSGRFAHHPAYLQDTFAAHFKSLSAWPTTIRLEAGVPVAGQVSIFQRV